MANDADQRTKLKLCTDCGGYYLLAFFRLSRYPYRPPGMKPGLQHYRDRCICCDALRQVGETMDQHLRRKALGARRRYGAKLKQLGMIKKESDLEDIYDWSLEQMVVDIVHVALGVQAEWQRRSYLARSLPGALEASSASGRFPFVQDISDPIAMGVHPAAAVEVAGMIDRIPAYITRDIEPELHAALRRGGFVLLVGESVAGKTRAAFEATRLLLGRCRFAAPSSREALPALLEVLRDTGDYVMWLDDLERFLGYGGLTTSVRNWSGA